jgi:hypothetical protein
VAHGADAVIAPDVAAWQIIYAVLRVRLSWPLYALLYLCVGMKLEEFARALALRSSTTSMARLISSLSSEALSSPNSKMRSKNAFSATANNFTNVWGSVASRASP